MANITVTENEINAKSGRIYSIQNNLLVVRECYRGVPRIFTQSVRGSVAEFSEGSARRMRTYLRTCKAEYTHLVTLTYPGSYPCDGAICKNHLRRFLQELKRDAYRLGDDTSVFSLFWFLEFQDRGAPHFHILSTRFFNYRWIAKVWYEIVNSEDSRHLEAGTRIEKLRLGRSGISSYAAKYANKQAQKLVPEGYEKVGRFWGVVGYKSTVSAATFVSRDSASDLDVSRSIFVLNKLIQQLLYEGHARIVSANDNSRVVALFNQHAVSKITAKICVLASRTHLSVVTLLTQDDTYD